jgi:hypothetical protein
LEADPKALGYNLLFSLFPGFFILLALDEIGKSRFLFQNSPVYLLKFSAKWRRVMTTDLIRNMCILEEYPISQDMRDVPTHCPYGEMRGL